MRETQVPTVTSAQPPHSSLPHTPWLLKSPQREIGQFLHCSWWHCLPALARGPLSPSWTSLRPQESSTLPLRALILCWSFVVASVPLASNRPPPRHAETAWYGLGADDLCCYRLWLRIPNSCLTLSKTCHLSVPHGGSWIHLQTCMHTSVAVVRPVIIASWPSLPPLS